MSVLKGQKCQTGRKCSPTWVEKGSPLAKERKRGIFFVGQGKGGGGEGSRETNNLSAKRKIKKKKKQRRRRKERMGGLVASFQKPHTIFKGQLAHQQD